MDILNTVNTGYAGLKFAKDTFQVLLGLKIEGEAQGRIVDALAKLGATQDTLFELREEMFRLQSDNEKLRQDLKARDDWESRRAGYSLQALAGGAVVFASVSQPRHFICPVCLERHEVQMLQPRGVLLDCPACKATYQASPYRDMPHRVERAITSDNAWEP